MGFFLDLGSGDGKKRKKAKKMTSFFFCFVFFFNFRALFHSPEQTVKSSKFNQHSVLNL